MDHLPVNLLQPHDEHRAVRFPQDRRPHLDDVVGPNGEEEPIERGVMQLAEGDAVADDRLALGVAVGRDVRRVQKLLMPESAERATVGVRSNHSLTEGDLVQPTAERRGHIGTPRLGDVLANDRQGIPRFEQGCSSRGGNVLLVDQPTNDLDVDTLGALEAGLESFPGCVAAHAV